MLSLSLFLDSMIHSSRDREVTLHEEEIYPARHLPRLIPHPPSQLSSSLPPVVKGSEIVLCFPLSRYRHLP